MTQADFRYIVPMIDADKKSNLNLLRCLQLNSITPILAVKLREKHTLELTLWNTF